MEIDPAPFVLIGRSSGDFIKICILRRLMPGASSYCDANWLEARITLNACPFHAEYLADAWGPELVNFCDDLKRLYQTLQGEGEYHAMEHWLHIRIRADRRGHFVAECEAAEPMTLKSKLQFKLEFDQTDIPNMINQLENILRVFPIQNGLPN